jgi:hypothetical protein
MDESPDGMVIFPEYPHHLLGFAGFREGREAPEIREQDDDFATMAVQHVLVADDEIGQLWRQEVA